MKIVSMLLKADATSIDKAIEIKKLITSAGVYFPFAIIQLIKEVF